MIPAKGDQSEANNVPELCCKARGLGGPLKRNPVPSSVKAGMADGFLGGGGLNYCQ